MLSEKLKKETLANHQQLEKMLVGNMKSIRSTQDYVDLLQLFYTYFGALETLIDQHIDAHELPDHAARRKSAALAQDITDLGGEPLPKATAADLPPISNALQAFAAMYVIEGSTLGGKIISKMMAQQLNITNSKGLSFFNGYGDDTDAMWLTFKQRLDAKPQNEQQEAEMIHTADRTFAMFHAWIAKQAA